MRDKDKICIEKIDMYCKDIMSFCDGISFDEFIANNMIKYSCSFALGQIGDLVKQISDELKQKYADIPWHKVAGFRNRVIHEYHRVDFDIFWEIVKGNIPELLNYTQEILNDIKQQEETQ